MGAMGAPHVFVCPNCAVVWINATVNDPVPLFVTVICCKALVVPFACVPNESDVGDMLTAGAVPVPARAMLCEEIPAPKLKSSVPFLVPVAVGVNTTFTSHFAPAATPELQLSVSEKSPVTEIVGAANGESPKFPKGTS